MDAKLQARIASKLLTARKKKGLTQKEIADTLGISEGQYSHYERCRAEPSINLIYEICLFYNESFDEWLGLPDKKSPPESENNDSGGSIESKLFYMFAKANKITEAGDISDTDKEFMTSLISLARAYLKQRRNKGE